MNKRWQLLEPKLSAFLKCHSEVNEENYPEISNLWKKDNSIENFEKIFVEYDDKDNIKIITGYYGENIVKLEFEKINDQKVVCYFKLNDEIQSKISEEIFEENLSYKFSMENYIDSRFNIEFELFSPEEILTSEDSITLSMEFHNEKYTEELRIGQENVPISITQIRSRVEQMEEGVIVSALHEDLIIKLIADVWDQFDELSIEDVRWQGALCAFGTGLSDLLIPILTAIYGAVNVLILDN